MEGYLEGTGRCSCCEWLERVVEGGVKGDGEGAGLSWLGCGGKGG